MRHFSIAWALFILLPMIGCTGKKDTGKIVFQSNRDGNFEIYSMNDDGSNLKRLTNSPSYDVSPSWSPDGSHIVFASDRDGNWEIYSMRSDGSDVKCLTSPPASNSAPSWTKDGTQIVFVSTRDAVNGEIYLMNADGSDVQRLTRDSTVKDSPVMTSDGAVVLFAANNSDGYSIVSLKPSNKSNSVLIPSSYNATSPRCSSDGSLVLFTGNSEGRSVVYCVALSGGNVKRLTSTNDDCHTPDWMGSSERILYSKNGGLYSLSLDTQKEGMLSNRGDSSPHWVRN